MASNTVNHLKTEKSLTVCTNVSSVLVAPLLVHLTGGTKTNTSVQQFSCRHTDGSLILETQKQLNVRKNSKTLSVYTDVTLFSIAHVPVQRV